MQLHIVAIACVAAILASAHSVYSATGVDMSGSICASMTLDTWKCLRSQGHTFAVIQAVEGGYGINQHLSQCYKDAKTAGFERVDVYAFVCPRCSGQANAATIANELADYMTKIGLDNSVTIWSDVEQCTNCWETDLSQNAAYVKSFMDALTAKGRAVGVYTNNHEASITIGTHALGGPLWYAHYDGKESFSDFVPFNGWTKPEAKQFQGTTSVCGTSVDYSWHP
jgi:GH25 family lysozyme M1 (1,4-beta-N-acetylmuramidase)